MNTIIGTCPICKKGNIIEKDGLFQCDYIVDTDNKCSFTLWKSFYKSEITTDIVKELINDGKTRILDNLITKDERRFSASIIIKEDGTIGLSFQNKALDMDCPICADKMLETSKSYICQGYINQSCDLYIPKVIAGVEIDTEILATLLRGETTDFITNFKKQDGTTFEAKLVLDADEHKVKFDSKIADCPKCQNGIIREWEKAFSCTNYKSETPCDFTVWKSQFGGTISRQNVIELCTKKATKSISFKTKNTNLPYKGKLILNEQNVIEMQKINN